MNRDRISLQPFFSPKSIMVIGASRNLYTFNGMILKNLLESQYSGEILIVHPFAKSILGIPCYRTVEDAIQSHDIPEIAILITRQNLPETLQSLGAAGIKYLLLQFDLRVDVPEERQQESIQELKMLIDQYQFHILGPCMIGIIDFQSKFTSSLIPVRSHIIQPNDPHRPTSGASFLAQSGGLAGACGWWAPHQPIPMAKIVHIGMGLGFSDADVIEFLFNDEATKVLLLLLRRITPEIIQIIKENNGKKPILFKYLGDSLDLVQQLRSSGAMEVNSYIELFEYAKLFLWCPAPPTNGIGIIGPSSGAINLISACFKNTGLHIAPLNPLQQDLIMQSIGGSTKRGGNPIDYWPPSEFVGRKVCQVYFSGSKFLLADDNVGILVLALEFFSEIEFNFNIFEGIKEKFPDKPIVVVLIQAESEGASRIVELATQLHIPVYIDEVERAVRGLQLLSSYYEQKTA